MESMMKPILKKLSQQENLSPLEMQTAMEEIMEGRVAEAQIAGFLMGLRIKGETLEELRAAVEVMRKKSTPVSIHKKHAIDTCGTGGDGANTFNVSTAAAFVIAAAGVTVVKHGNRSVSSRCGSADVLQALGVPIDLSPEEAAESIHRLNMGFLFAPQYHQAMRHVKGVRSQLGIRTIFNVLGPLTNPAGVQGQVLGVFAPELTETLASVLKALGTKAALVVHGLDGLDEMTITAQTKVTELKDNQLQTYYVAPQDFGFPLGTKEALQGQDAAVNAEIILAILKGEKGSRRNMVALNAGAGIYVGKKAATLLQGVRLAEEIIDRGLALKKLNQLAAWRAIS